MSLIAAGSAEWKWDIQLKEMARIWKGGCIIRAKLLDDIMRAYERDPHNTNLLLESEFSRKVIESEKGWRYAVRVAQEQGIPVPAMSASLAYFDAYRSATLPQSLTQAQRDFFGAHTYQRADRPEAGFVHSDWQSLVKRT